MKDFKMKTGLLILTVILFCTSQYPQKYLENEFKGRNPEEMVTLSPSLPFDKAIELLSKVSENTTGKKILSTVSLPEPIGIDIENMAYDKALVVLIQYKGLIFDEREDLIIIKRKNEPKTVELTGDIYAPVEEREVNISAVFFEMDVNESKERGIDWRFLLSGQNLNIGGQQGLNRTESSGGSGGSGGEGNTEDPVPTFELNGLYNFDVGGFFGAATATFKFFENENVGEIIASPNLTVRNAKPARLQAGQDISIKQKDFAGNVIEEFYSTGTIMNVTPYVYEEDGVNYLLLNIDVERSSYIPDPTTTIINKTRATTQVMMLNGEETVIGGLFVNDETVVRNGVPFLKDLPWWFFGLRYLFGSDQTIVTKKELVILIKADLVPTLKERLAWPQSPNRLQEEVKKQREKIKFHQFNQVPNEN